MSEDLIPQQILVLLSLVGLFFIYLSAIPFGGIFSIIAVIFAVMMGTNSLRHIGNYSLGTGIPSIIYFLTAGSLIAMIGAMSVSSLLNNDLYFPVLSVIFSIVISYVISVVCKHVFKIEIEILSKSFMEIAVASNLVLMGFSTLLVTSYSVHAIFSDVISNALILLLMFMVVMIIQNPYNSCMGPNEDQYRTLTLALANAFLMLMILSIISMLFNQLWILYLVISIIGWIINYRRYVKYSLRQAASVKYYGIWATGDEGDYLW